MPKPRVPTAHKKALGKQLDPRFVNKNEPKPDLIDASEKAPAFLTKQGKKAFVEIKEMLTVNGVLTIMDMPAFALLCDHYGTYMEVREIIQREGYQITEETKQGSITKRHPLLGTLNETHGRVIKLLTEYGMTPASRGKVGAVEARVDPLEGLLSG